MLGDDLAVKLQGLKDGLGQAVGVLDLDLNVNRSVRLLRGELLGCRSTRRLTSLGTHEFTGQGVFLARGQVLVRDSIGDNRASLDDIVAVQARLGSDRRGRRCLFRRGTRRGGRLLLAERLLDRVDVAVLCDLIAVCVNDGLEHGLLPAGVVRDGEVNVNASFSTSSGSELLGCRVSGWLTLFSTLVTDELALQGVLLSILETTVLDSVGDHSTLLDEVAVLQFRCSSDLRTVCRRLIFIRAVGNLDN